MGKKTLEETIEKATELEHHKHSRSSNFNRICSKILKQYVRAKFVNFKM
jgi:hypothetical protein